MTKRCFSSSNSIKTKKHCCFMATSTADKDFVSWLTANDYLGLDGLEFRTSELGSLGCFAKIDFHVGDLLFAVPCKCMITNTDANQSDLIALIRQGVSELQLSGTLQSSPAVMTAELLLWVFLNQQLHSTDGIFGPFLRTLDVVSPSPLSWPDDLLESLHGTNMDTAVSIEALARQCALLEEVRLWGEQNGKDVSILRPETMNVAALCWARGHYLSRRYPAHFGGQKGSNEGLPGEAREEGMENLGTLVPLLDILNHSDRHDYLAFTVENGYLNVVCNYPRQKGDELLSNYGKLSNENLLFAYGFSIENNAYDAIALKLMCRMSLGTKQGIAKNLGTFYTGRGGIEAVPEELWRALSSLVTDDAPAGEGEDGDDVSPVPHDAVEVGIEEIDILHRYIKMKLSQLEASRERAEFVLAGYESEGDSRVGWIRHYRNGQTEILRELSADLTTWLNEEMGGYRKEEGGQEGEEED